MTTTAERQREAIAAHVAKLVAAAPEIRPEVRQQLAHLLRPAPVRR